MKTYFPPENPDLGDGRRTYFLAGAIDNGAAEPWQARLTEDLSDLDATLLNPRRADWDPSIPCTAEDPRFAEQVEWEMRHLGAAEAIIFYFPAGSKAPITLLELGLYGTPAKAIVFCPPGYYRAGNVHIVCRKRGLALFTDYDELVAAIRESLGAGGRLLAAVGGPEEDSADTPEKPDLSQLPSAAPGLPADEREMEDA